MFLANNKIFKFLLLANVVLFIVGSIYLMNKTTPNQLNRINGCIIILLDNNQLNRLVELIERLELIFNNKYNYPYVLFNNEEFTNDFKTEIVKHTDSTVEFGLIPNEHWSVPVWIDRQKLNESFNKIGFSIGYRHMCRFYSGFFFRHKLTLKYDYYMRLDSDSGLPCQFTQDPFEKLHRKEIKYGFILASNEHKFVIPKLWSTIKNWTNETSINRNKITNGIKFISDDGGDSLNKELCMFYNNFEIADFALFRNETYLNFFNYLDKSGGFFYGRWVNKNFLDRYL